MSTYLIIGDIHGQLDALEALIAKAPEHQRRIYLGDLIDRGPKCIETLQYVMNDVKNNGALCLYGNHEDMMIQALHDRQKFGYIHMWMNNGGHPTYEKFKLLPESEQTEMLRFLMKLPTYVEGPGFIAAHSAIIHKNVEELMSYLDRNGARGTTDFVWNHNPPSVWPDVVKIQGHLGTFQKYMSGDRAFAYCVDDTKNGNLAAIHWPSQVVITENFMGETNEEGQAETQAKTEVQSH